MLKENRIEFGQSEIEKPLERPADRLAETLRHQLTIYSHLYDLISKEKQILIGAQLDQLVENNQAKEKMLERLNELETQRRNCVMDLALELNLKGEPRLSECLPKVPSQTRESLVQLRDGLILAIERVAELNRGNEMLVEASLQNIGSAIQNLTGQVKAGATYQRKGQMSQQNAAGRLVRREV